MGRERGSWGEGEWTKNESKTLTFFLDSSPVSRLGEETEADGIKSFLKTVYFIKPDRVIILISQ
jgi:hypothetical protein